MRIRLAVLLIAASAIAGFAQFYYLPHLPVGGGYRTSITVSNLMPEGQKVLISFYKEDGTIWAAPTSTGNRPVIGVDLAAMGSGTAELVSQSSQIESGWALVSGAGPLVIAANYALEGSAGLESTAGVLAAQADTLSILPVTIDPARGIDTGAAIVNPAKLDGDATIQLIDTLGQVVATQTIHLVDRGKVVGFLSAAPFFPGLGAFSGYARIDSLQPLAVMGLRTDGTLFSSLPAVHDILPWRNAHTVYVNPSLSTDSQSDGSLAKPYKTIRKAQEKADRGWTVYLLPGLYGTHSWESFPLVINFCIHIRGASAESVVIIGGGEIETSPVNCTFVCDYRGAISNVTIINPAGAGIYTQLAATIHACKIMNCGSFGVLVGNSTPVLSDNVITQNEIGVYISEHADPDLGAGLLFSPGGNFLLGNLQCDVYYEGNSGVSLRYNNWDSPAPTRSEVCEGGADFACPYALIFHY